MFERLVLEPRLLKQIVTPRFVEDDLVTDRNFKRLEFGGILDPFHFPLQSTLDRTEPIYDLVFRVLNSHERFILLHVGPLRSARQLRYKEIIGDVSLR